MLAFVFFIFESSKKEKKQKKTRLHSMHNFLFTKWFFHSAKSMHYHFALKTQYTILDFSGFLCQAFHITIDFIHLTLTKVLFNFYLKLPQILVNRLWLGFHAKSYVLTRTHDHAVMNFWMYVAQLSKLSVFLIVFFWFLMNALSTSLWRNNSITIIPSWFSYVTSFSVSVGHFTSIWYILWLH